MNNENLRNINYSNKHIQQKNSTMLETSFGYSLSHLQSSFPLLCRMVVTKPNWKSDFLVGQYSWRNRPIRNSQVSDWCNLIMMSFIKKIVSCASFENECRWLLRCMENVFFTHYVCGSRVQLECKRLLCKGLINIQLGMSPRWNFTNSSNTEWALS